MYELYDNYWDHFRSARPLQFAIAFSVVVHAAFGFAFLRASMRPPLKPIPISYEVQLIEQLQPEPEPEAKPVEEKPPPPPPPPPPPKPKPKPKPEPKKEVAKKVEKKPEPKKVEKKPEPKPPPPKPKPKPKPEVVQKPPPPKPVPKPEVVAKAPPPQTGVQQQQLPSLLNAWGRLVQRKVEKYWQIPGGISINEENYEVHISFVVDREGQLVSQPRIVKNAKDPSLGESGIRSILNAIPLPPFPPEHNAKQQEVIYVFSLKK